MKFKKICFIFTLICICMGATLFFSGCQSTDNCMITSAESFRISDTYLYTAVSNDTVKFTFYDKIKVSDNCVWSLHLDSAALDSLTINSKTINLEIGDNIYYILVKTTDGKNVKLYTVNVRRKPIYTVTFKNFDSSIFKKVYIEEGLKISEPETKPSREGYIFINWIWDFSKAIESDKIITPKFSPIDYTITYYLNGGVNNPLNPAKYNIENQSLNLYAPTKDGYNFIGWYNNNGCIQNKIEIVESNSLSNIELWARWELIDYTITYILDGGVNSNKNPLSYNIVSPTIILQCPEKNDYVFEGWYTDSQFKGSKITEITSGNFGDISLYAKWYDNYAITYELDGGTNNINNPKFYNIKTVDLQLFEPSKENYVFLGWYNNREFNGMPLTQIDKNINADVILFSKWLLNISTKEDLIGIQNDIYVDCILKNDIDLNGMEWEPIRKYRGIFDGQGFTISNYKITKNYVDINIGFFNSIDGIIKNLKVKDFYISSSRYCCGGLAATMGENSSVINCSAEGTIMSVDKSDSVYVSFGGLIGSMGSNAKIEKSYSNVDLSVDCDYKGNNGGWNGNVYVGGLVGSGRYFSVVINNSYATGNVIVKSSNMQIYAGGLVGCIYGVVEYCYSMSNVKAVNTKSTSYAGALVGYTSKQLQNCFASGNVYAESKEGKNENYVCAGSLVGKCEVNLYLCYYLDKQIIISILMTENGNINSAGICSSFEGIIDYIKKQWDSTIWNINLEAFPTLR